MRVKQPTFDLDSVTPEELEDIVIKLGGQRAFSRKYGVPRSTLQLRLSKVQRNAFGHRPPPEARKIAVDGPVARFILTSAQDATSLHHEFLDNLEAYRDYLQAYGPCEIMIAGFTYNKRLFENHDPSKEPYWDARIEPYMVQERVRLGDMIDFCGEMNTLPTAKTPLTGFETYTRHRWGVFPHAKVQLRSIPTMKNSPAKLIMTTGAVTKPNYVRKRAGIEASFHHSLGAVLVEIASNGEFFCRHLLGEEDGSFYDLDVYVQTNIVALTDEEIIERKKLLFADSMRTVGKFRDTRPKFLEQRNDTTITVGHNAKAINWGDLHVAQIDPEVSETCFGFAPTNEKGNKGRMWVDLSKSDTILDSLRPEYQFFHDVADFESRNHHNLRDPHHMYELFVKGVDSVENELREVAMFIDRTRRDFCETVIVESNHDLALKRWLKEADYRSDPLNARFFLRCQEATYAAIEERNKRFSIFEHVLTKHFEEYKCEGVRFLREDESFMVLDIEKGMHGHLGTNGARGTPHTFVKAGAKSTTGHTHSCEIRDGAYVSGTTSKLDMGYNRGLSSWSHSHVLTYQNGKRAILTIRNGKWRL